MYICIYTSTIYSVSVLIKTFFSKNRDSSRVALGFFYPDGVFLGPDGVKKGVKGLILVNSQGFALWRRSFWDQNWTKIDLPGRARSLPGAPGTGDFIRKFTYNGSPQGDFVRKFTYNGAPQGDFIRKFTYFGAPQNHFIRP